MNSSISSTHSQYKQKSTILIIDKVLQLLCHPTIKLTVDSINKENLDYIHRLEELKRGLALRWTTEDQLSKISHHLFKLPQAILDIFTPAIIRTDFLIKC